MTETMQYFYTHQLVSMGCYSRRIRGGVGSRIQQDSVWIQEGLQIAIEISRLLFVVQNEQLRSSRMLIDSSCQHSIQAADNALEMHTLASRHTKPIDPRAHPPILFVQGYELFYLQ